MTRVIKARGGCRDWAVEHPTRLDAIAFLARYENRGAPC